MLRGPPNMIRTFPKIRTSRHSFRGLPLENDPEMSEDSYVCEAIIGNKLLCYEFDYGR